MGTFIDRIKGIFASPLSASFPSSPILGQQFTHSTQGPMVWNGTSWRSIGAGVAVTPAVRVRRSANGVLSAGAWTAIGFDVEEYDTAAMHDPATNNSRLVAPIAGIYHVDATIMWDQTQSAGRRLIAIRVNGIDVDRGDLNLVTNTLAFIGTTATVKLNAGDYVEVFGYGDSAYTVMGGTPAAGQSFTNASMFYVGAATPDSPAYYSDTRLNEVDPTPAAATWFDLATVGNAEYGPAVTVPIPSGGAWVELDAQCEVKDFATQTNVGFGIAVDGVMASVRGGTGLNEVATVSALASVGGLGFTAGDTGWGGGVPLILGNSRCWEDTFPGSTRIFIPNATGVVQNREIRMRYICSANNQCGFRNRRLLARLIGA